MKIEIQAYWGAETKSIEKADNVESAEEWLRYQRHIVVCDIVIDGKLRGSVIWDGRFLNILHENTETFLERKEEKQHE